MAQVADLVVDLLAQRDEDVVRLDIQVGQLLAVDILQTLENYNKIYQ